MGIGGGVAFFSGDVCLVDSLLPSGPFRPFVPEGPDEIARRPACREGPEAAPGGKRMELADSWAEMQLMARMARELFAQCAAAPA